MQETQGQSLGQEDPLEEGVAASSTVLGQRIPQTEVPGGMSPGHRKELDERKLEEVLRARVRAEVASPPGDGKGGPLHRCPVLQVDGMVKSEQFSPHGNASLLRLP